MVRACCAPAFRWWCYDPITQMVQSLEKEGARPPARRARSPNAPKWSCPACRCRPTSRPRHSARRADRGLRPRQDLYRSLDHRSLHFAPVNEALAAKGVRMLDCPVGKGAEAARGELTLMVGGDAAVLDEVREVLSALGSPIHALRPGRCRGRRQGREQPRFLLAGGAQRRGPGAGRQVGRRSRRDVRDHEEHRRRQPAFADHQPSR